MTGAGKNLLLFDLGNVIVEVTGSAKIDGLLARPETLEAYYDFETGRLAPEEFARRIVEHTGSAPDATSFLSDFELWCGAPYPGTADTLAALRGRFRLAALSNSNAVHWQRLDGFGLHGMFERTFSSHQLGVRKPMTEIYEEALRRLGVPAEQTTFFDDLEVNVEAARRVGMTAYQVVGPDALRSCLRELGYLEAAG